MGQKSIIVNTPNKKNHSDAQDWAAIFNGLYGGSTGILPIGSKLVVGVNEEFVIINDGVFSLDGHMLRVKDGTKQFLKLPETEVGKKRIAYVVAQYVVNTKLEDDTLEFAILAGEQDDINPLPPQVTIGNIDRGDRLNQAIIAELLIDGNKAQVNRYGKKAIMLPYLTKQSEGLESKVMVNSIPNRVNAGRVFRTMFDRTDKSLKMRTQGMTFDGTYFYMAYIPMEDKDEKDVTLRKFDKTGNLVLEKELIDGYHANSMCVVNNEIYIAISKDKKILVIDKNLNHTRTIVCDVQVSAISVKDNQLWTLGDEVNIMKILTLEGKLIRTFRLTGFNLDEATVGQSIYVSDFIYRVKSNPNCIYVYKLDGELIRKLDIKENFTVKEYEDIEYHNGVFYLSYQSAYNYSNWVTGINYFVPSNTLIERSTLPNENDTTVEVYVDNNTVVNNPDGSSKKPFNEIQEALDYLLSINNLSKRLIVKKSSKKYNYFRILGHNNITINADKGAIVNSFDVTSSTGIAIRNLTVEHNGIGSQISEFVDCDVKLRDCTYGNISGNKKINAVFNARLVWLGDTSSLTEGSVYLGHGSEFIGYKKVYTDFIVPIGSSWSCNAPIRIWGGYVQTGIIKFREGINLSNFKWLTFTLNNNDTIRIRADKGLAEIRSMNMGNSAGEITTVIAEWQLDVKETEINALVLKGIVMDATGNKTVNPSFRIIEVYGE